MRATLLTLASLLLSFSSLVSSAEAAPPLPVCGAGQWVLPGPTIGAGVAGSVVQAVVLGADGTVALTGACPPVAAKVKGIRAGTSVKASWPAGFCGGVGGKGKLAATIDPACLTMQGKLSAAQLRRTFDAPRSPCDVGLLDTGGTPRCVAPAIATGTAATHATLDDGGCLVGDVTVTTASGVSVQLASGSCLLAGKKPLKGGDVELALDDAGGPPSGAGVAGIVRLRVRPKGKGAPLVVSVDPPATLTLPLGDALTGTWFTNAFLDAGGFTTTLHDATPVLLDAVPVGNGGAGRAAIATAGPLGLSFESRAAASTVQARRRSRAAGSSTASFAIPPDPNLPDPRVVSWAVINPKTAQVVVVGLPLAELGVGDSDTSFRQGHAFVLTVLESSGQRRVEVTSDFSNRFVLELGLHDGTNGNTSTALGDAVGGCADETCLADAYVGFVKVTVRAKNFKEVISVRDTIAGRLPAGAQIAIRSVRKVGRSTQSVMSIFGLDGSVQTVTPGLPTAWAVAASDRTLDIDTHPANVLGEWQGTMVITGNGGSLGCFENDPLCARLSVQSGAGGLRIAYCNSVETQCAGSAAAAPCALLFDGHATAAGLTGVGFNNNAPCCVGCPGQSRVYGCQLNATVTVDGRGQQTLEGTFGGSVTFCPSDAGGSAVTHIKMCRPKPCAVP